MSRKTRIGLTRDLIDNQGNFLAPGPGLDVFKSISDVEYEVFPEWHPEVTPEQIEGFDFVVSLTPKWTSNTVKNNDQLVSVHRWGVGYDMIDVPALTEAGVALYITPDAVRRPVAVTVLAFLLALSTKLFLKDKLTREGNWADRGKHLGIGLVGRTLGLIGVGNIGHEVFRLAKPLEMRHIAYDPYTKQEQVADTDVELMDFDTVLSESDFLSINCPLNKETYHLIGEAQLRKMKPTSFLINTARGPVVDEQALIRALTEGWIQGAGIDVFEQEPTPITNPLLKLQNTILAPHALAWMDQTFMDEWNTDLGQILQLKRGEKPSGLVNKEIWENPKFQQKLQRVLDATA